MSLQLKIQLTFLQVFGSEVAPLVGVRDWHEYLDGKKGNLLGTVYDLLVLPSCATLSVKVPASPVITQEELNTHNQALDFVMCKMDGFTARPYVNSQSNSMQLTAQAKGITIVQRSASK